MRADGRSKRAFQDAEPWGAPPSCRDLLCGSVARSRIQWTERFAGCSPRHPRVPFDPRPGAHLPGMCASLCPNAGRRGIVPNTVVRDPGEGFPVPHRHNSNWEGTPEMSMPRGITRSMAAVALSVAALTATTATDAHAADADVSSAVVAEQDSSSTDRTKEERVAPRRARRKSVRARTAPRRSEQIVLRTSRWSATSRQPPGRSRFRAQAERSQETAESAPVVRSRCTVASRFPTGMGRCRR